MESISSDCMFHLQNRFKISVLLVYITSVDRAPQQVPAAACTLSLVFYWTLERITDTNDARSYSGSTTVIIPVGAAR